MGRPLQDVSSIAQLLHECHVDLSLLVAPKAFLSLPLGTVKPAGWLYDQVRVGGLTHTLISHHLDSWSFKPMG